MSELLSKELAPVYVAIIWVAFWIVVLMVFRRPLERLGEVLLDRIRGGSSITLGSFSIGEPPQELIGAKSGSVAVSDTREAKAVQAKSPPENLDAKYKEIVEGGYFLLHAVEVIRPRTTPRTGAYRVRVWLESLSDPKLLKVARVTYRLWDDFNNPTISTASSQSAFDVWLVVYGEFPVLASIVLRDARNQLITRYIDIPGRPPD